MRELFWKTRFPAEKFQHTTGAKKKKIRFGHAGKVIIKDYFKCKDNNAKLQRIYKPRKYDTTKGSQ